ncbi:hypothetical protein SRHO_G00249880 [Serrasalmus rhombeus]
MDRHRESESRESGVGSTCSVSKFTVGAGRELGKALICSNTPRPHIRPRTAVDALVARDFDDSSAGLDAEDKA